MDSFTGRRDSSLRSSTNYDVANSGASLGDIFRRCVSLRGLCACSASFMVEAGFFARGKSLEPQKTRRHRQARKEILAVGLNFRILFRREILFASPCVLRRVGLSSLQNTL